MPKPGYAVQNDLDETQPEPNFSIFRKTVSYLKSAGRSVLRSIENLGNSAYKKRIKELDLFNLENKTS